MDDTIKSAYEIAMEKVEKMGEATEEERLSWKYVPQGELLAGKYMSDECNLVSEIGRLPEDTKKYVLKGLSDILTRNLSLPKNDVSKNNNRKAMDGLKIAKNDKVALENVFSKLRYLFNHYAEQGEQQKKQAYESLKTEFTAKVQQAAQQQLGTAANVNIDVERQPQFQQEWLRVQAQLESQYQTLLSEHKQELSNID